MKKGTILLAAVMIAGMIFSSAWAQSVEDITWTPGAPTTATPVTYVVKVSNPGPEAPICVRLVTPGGSLTEQVHPGIGVTTTGPINVRFKPVAYAKPGKYEVRAMLMTKECTEPLKQAKAPLRVESVLVRAP